MLLYRQTLSAQPKWSLENQDELWIERYTKGRWSLYILGGIVPGLLKKLYRILSAERFSHLSIRTLRKEFEGHYALIIYDNENDKVLLVNSPF